MGRANDDTGASGDTAPSSAIPSLNQTSLEDYGLPPYTEAVAGPPVAREDVSSYAIHDPSPQLCQPGSIIPSTVVSSTRGSTRVSLSSTVASDPKLLQSFVKSEARRMPNLIVRLIGTHTEKRPRDRENNETTVRDFDIRISWLICLPRLGGGLDWHKIVTRYIGVEGLSPLPEAITLQMG